MEARTVVLWRPVGPVELDLIRKRKMRGFPPRLPSQPFFYPVTSEAYASEIARRWNSREAGVGYVTRFRVAKAFLDRYSPHEAGGRRFVEYWIPAGDLPGFNAAIVGNIEIVREFLRKND